MQFVPAQKLGFGLMRLPLFDPDDDTTIDVEQVKKMTDLFLERGFTYFDTAYMYHTFRSESIVREVLTDRHPRESFTVATKMPTMMLTKEADVERIFNEQKEKTGLSYFDYYLMHDMNVANYELAKKYGAIEFARKKQAEGEILHLGFSCHDNPEFLDRVLTENPFFEFVQLQINYLDWDSAGIQSRRCYEVCVKHGKKVIVMEGIKGGTLASVPENVMELMQGMHPDWAPASWALRFAATHENVMTVLSGMSALEQMDDNTAFMKDAAPLNEEELALLDRCASLIRQTIAVPCTGCRYCVEANHCPMGIPIPNYFALYNTEKMRKREDFSPEKEYYANWVKQDYGRASACISCRGCERVCPQHIHISERLKEVAQTLEEGNDHL
ncbi:MAG: aldo/keto reductase [Clostridia bacterium]|nr:aldo/keto reductase [Clostridia bacterium]